MSDQENLADFETIKLVLQGQVAMITLNRPQRLNAAPPQMFDEIGAAMQRLPGLGARALLLTGEGKAFCSGADLQANHNAPVGETRGERSHRSLTEHYGPALLALSQLGMPVISAVNGAAAGIGCSLALSADFVLAARSAYFLQAFVNIGMVPDGGASWMLPRLIGKSRATEMMMLGERVAADKAESWGLIHKAVDDADLLDQAMVLAQRLANGPTLALGLMRQGLAGALSQSHEQAMAVEANHQALSVSSADAAEGRAAFAEKRKPVFKGS